ncbi:MAG: trehalose-phosphatase [Candidatus Verstraetearchaeota archaeon]|nr:trehalose-phosphatase [Candidatus Verstraetearchaeota archaeon]
MKALKSALKCFGEVVREMGQRNPAVFLDYDGSLTPIVDDPDSAFLHPATKAVLMKAKEAFPLGIISGRDLDDLARRVGLEGVTLAGSHGFDIMLKDGRRLGEGRWSGFGMELDLALKELAEAVGRIGGVKIERKRFAVTVHYRQARAGDKERILKEFDSVASKHESLRKSYGKTVAELLPKAEWNKGTALLEILTEEGLSEQTHFVFFAGDDVTDEDAFKVVKRRGIGIFVGEPERQTEAEYQLSSPDELRSFIERLLANECVKNRQ